ncbi:MAG: amino acid adenylation domain-containing protein [Campylobacter sp.]
MITSVCDFLDKSALKFGSKTAFVEGEKSVTYAEFDEFSDMLASEILRILPNFSICKPVLILLPKGIDCLISFFGVAKSGNFYTLLDEKTPRERLLKVVEILKPQLLITSDKFDLGYLNLPTLFSENFAEFTPDKTALYHAKNRHIDTNLLYVFFTSGSTGTPKGVSITHKSVIDYTFWVCETFDMSEREILANQAPFYFDNSILDIFSSVKVGATLHILQTLEFAFPLRVINYLKTHKISMIFWVPSVLIYFANSNALENAELGELKKVLFCGEIMPNKQLNIWRRRVNWAKFANLYGPTEITDVCGYYVCEREFGDDETLPIGKACKNTQLMIFDENLRLITPDMPNVKGELCVRGTGLSAGYYGDKAKTAKAFIQNPLHDDYDDKIYRTGDIACYNEFGEILCFGRLDNQVKILGHRVELGEIETAVNSHAEILNCACVFNGEITCFYEAKCEINLVRFLKDKLPPYMIPKSFIKIDKFKLNQNGKIDRVDLAKTAHEMG